MSDDRPLFEPEPEAAPVDLDAEIAKMYGREPEGPTGTREAFAAFHAANPHVYREFVRMARLWKDRGRRRLGIAMLLEVVRWNIAILTDSEDEFKVNNNFKPFYARLIMRQEPDLLGVFETREIGGK